MRNRISQGFKIKKETVKGGVLCSANPMQNISGNGITDTEIKCNYTNFYTLCFDDDQVIIGREYVLNTTRILVDEYRNRRLELNTCAQQDFTLRRYRNE